MNIKELENSIKGLIWYNDVTIDELVNLHKNLCLEFTIQTLENMIIKSKYADDNTRYMNFIFERKIEEFKKYL